MVVFFCSFSFPLWRVVCSSLDYDDDRYYIANNLRNSHYALHPNPSPVQNPYVQKPIVVTNYPSNRLISQMKRTSLTSSPTDPKQDVGLPRSSIVWAYVQFQTIIKCLRNEMNFYQRATSPIKSHILNTNRKTNTTTNTILCINVKFSQKFMWIGFNEQRD